MAYYLIWSNQHAAWWKPGARGYTTLTHEAGRYSAEQADAILRQANFNPHAPPDEVKCLAPSPIQVKSEIVSYIAALMGGEPFVEQLRQGERAG